MLEKTEVINLTFILPPHIMEDKTKSSSSNVRQLCKISHINHISLGLTTNQILETIT